MNTPSSLCFGFYMPESDNPQPPQTASTTNPPNPIAPPREQPQPSSQNSAPKPSTQFVYERYFKQVSKRDFQHSNLLQQYARERNTTSELLWHHFCVHITKNNLENNLANLISYLSIPQAKTDAGTSQNNSLDSSNDDLARSLNNFLNLEGNDEEDNYEVPPPRIIVKREFPKMYSREDFLRLKREAELEFEKKLEEQERRAAERNRV